LPKGRNKTDEPRAAGTRANRRDKQMEWENSSLGSLFVPDVLTPEQFYDSRRDDSTIRPVKKLMMAILEDALRCFQNNADAKGGPRKRLFNEAEQWLIGEGGEGPFSFALDTGASHSVIDEDLAERLKLPRGGPDIEITGVAATA